MFKKTNFIYKVSLLTIGLILAIFNNVNAEQSIKFGDYTIHYNATYTEMIPVDVAKGYGIIRSKNRALLTVSVRKGEDVTNTKSFSAKVVTNVTNLTGQQKSVVMKEISEPGAVYYVGVFTISDKETFDFNIAVTPENKGKATEIKFRQQFFVK
jgi:hypothetical protein